MGRALKFARINEKMERRKLSDLPVELIMKIFSLLPMFKESVATHLISKRKEDPWKPVPDVTLEDDDDESFVTIMSFIYGSLLSNDAQILDSLHLKLTRKHSASDINFWIQIAVNRYVRKLRINLFGRTLELPSCLSTCTTLKSLILREVSIKVIPPAFRLASLKSLHLLSVRFFSRESVVRLLESCPVLEYLVVNQTKYCNPEIFNFAPPRFCLSSSKILHNVISNVTVPHRFCLSSSLKSLHLLSVRFSSGGSFATLLKSCAALEDLVINQTKNDNVMVFDINVPSLRSLSIDNSKGKRSYVEGNHGFVINTPSLEKLKFKDAFSNFLVFEHMPKVTKANIEVMYDKSDKLFGSLTSIQHLSLCFLTSKTPYPCGTIFPYLEHLELCTCSAGWANLLASILNDAPRLGTIELKSHHARYNDPINLWNEPTVVPECLSTNLEILEWRQYEGTEQEREVAAYILTNATCLKMATFWTRCRNKYHRILKKLQKPKRGSEKYQFLFE